MWKKIMVRSGSLSVFLFFSFFISCFLASSPSYALSDLVITLSSSSDYPILCSSSTPCSDYKYLIIEADSSVPNTSSLTLTAHKLSNGYFYNFQVPLRSKYLILKLDNLNFSDSNFKDFQVSGFSNFSSGTIILTFTEDELSFSQNCPICPEIPENPYDDKFDQVIHAIYVCAGVMLVLYFFYCIYRLIIRNSGVK